jgi:hypothetical protein
MGSNQSIENFDFNKLGTCNLNMRLTETNISLIQSNWKIISNNDDIGLSIMIRIFQAHTNIKHVWIFTTKLTTEEEMRKDPQVRYHAQKLIATFEKIINKLDADLSFHKEYLIKLGKNHFHYDVKYEYFKVINY